MAAYRLLLHNLLSGEQVAELPATSLAWTEELDEAGSITATLPISTSGPIEMPVDYLDLILDEGPVAFYRMAEASGTTMVDDAGGYDGTYLNGPVVAQDGPTSVIRRAVSFDASNDRATVTAPPFGFAGTAPFSVEFWVLIPNTPTDFDRILSFETTTNDDGWWVVWHSTQGIRFFRSLDGTTLGQLSVGFGSAITLNTWYHVVATYSGTQMRIYRDGVLMNTTANTRALPADPGNLNVNTGPTGAAVCGCQLAAVSIWDRQLSDDEVLAHYEFGTGARGDTRTITAPEPFSIDDLPARHAVYVERDGVLMAGGIVWTADADISSGTWELGASGFHSWLRDHRFITEDLTYDGVDQLAIAQDLIDWAQATSDYAELGLTVGGETSGVLRDRTYLGIERKSVGEAIAELGAVINGFNWRWVAERDPITGAISNRFVPTYPAAGRVTDHLFELGVNCTVLNYSVDGTTVANIVHGVGAGDGDDQIRTTRANAVLLGPYPQLEDVISHTDVSVQATLDGHADRRLQRGNGVMRQMTIETPADTIPVLGAYVVGDQVRVRARYGAVQVDDRFRITAITVNAVDGSERVAISLAAAQAFADI